MIFDHLLTRTPKRSCPLLLGGALLSLAFVVSGCSTVNITVRNDTGVDVRISACVDDAVGVDAGDTFVAGGVPDNDHLFCLVIANDESERCVAIPHADEIDGRTFPLSRVVPEPMTKCP
jgi:hypothetical protein